MQGRPAAGLAVLAVAALAGPASAAWLLPGGSGAGHATSASLAAPTGVRATAVGTGAVDIAFTPAVGQPTGTSTRVVRERADGPGTVVCAPATSPCRDAGLQPGTTYSYTAQTVLAGWSRSSGQVSATTDAAPATSLGITAATRWVAGAPQTVTLTARSSSGATDPGFSGSRPVSWGGTAGVAPGAPTTVTFSGGTATASVALTKAGPGTLTATTSGLSPASADVAVTAGPVALSLTCPASAPRGSSVTVTLHRAATDAYGNADARAASALTVTVASSTNADRVGTSGTSSASVTLPAGAASSSFPVVLSNGNGTSAFTSSGTADYTAAPPCSTARS